MREDAIKYYRENYENTNDPSDLIDIYNQYVKFGDFDKGEEILNEYEVDTIAIGMPINMNGTKTERAEVTEKFIHKLQCKFNKIKIVRIDERLTTVEAHKTMNFLNINKHKKRNIVDTISAVYILESYMKLNENK